MVTVRNCDHRREFRGEVRSMPPCLAIISAGRYSPRTFSGNSVLRINLDDARG